MNQPPVSIDVLLTHSSWLQGLAVELVGDPTRAEDFVQETWARSLKSPPTKGVPIRPWLAKVLRNLVREEWRSTQSRVQREVHRGHESPHTSAADEIVARAHSQRRLVEAVLELDERYSAVLLMRYFDGLGADEIARRIGVTSSTIRTRLQRGLEQLRALLTRQHGDQAATWLSALAVGATRAAMQGAPSGAHTAVAGQAAVPRWVTAALMLLVPVAVLGWWVIAGERTSPSEATVILDAPRGSASASVLEQAAIDPIRRTPAFSLQAAPEQSRSLAPEAAEVAATPSAVAQVAPAPDGEAARFVVSVRVDGSPAKAGMVAMESTGWLPDDLGDMDRRHRSSLGADGQARLTATGSGLSAVGVQLATGGVLQKGLRGPIEDVVLEIGTARIEGIVWRADGTPARGVEVTYGAQKGLDYGALTAIRTTDRYGRFELHHLPEGRFWIFAELECADVIRVHGTLALGEERDVQLGSPTGKVTLQGRVVTQGGDGIVGHAPYQRGRIEFSRRGTVERVVHPAELGANGGYAVRMTPGDYDVRLIPHTIDQSVSLASCTITGDETRDWILPGARVHGLAYMVGEGRRWDPDLDPLVSLTLARTEEAGDEALRHRATVGPDGRFVFDGVMDGTWQLSGPRLAGAGPVSVLVLDSAPVLVDIQVQP